MQIKIGEYEYTECWDGVLYKKLSNYPNISEWEIQTIYDFMKYETDNGRECDIDTDAVILKPIKEYRPIYEAGVRVPVPSKEDALVAMKHENKKEMLLKADEYIKKGITK